MRSTAVLATGKWQPAYISNGLATVRARLLDRDVNVKVYSWTAFRTMEEVVDELASDSGPYVFAGHSYGCWFLTLLAKECDGIANINAMILADPVTRPPGGTLEIPGNVREVSAWRKRKGVIPTAKIDWAGGNPRWATVDVTHARVDECQGFQDAVVHAAVMAALSP